MDAKWKREGQRLQRRIGMHVDLAQDSEKDHQPSPPDPNVFPSGQPHLVVRHPVLILPPVLIFGALLYKLATLWLSGW